MKLLKITQSLKCLLLTSGLAAGVFIGGCADDQARAQLADTNAQLAKLQNNVGALDNKVSNQKLIDILNKLDSLQSQIDQLNGDVATLKDDQRKYQATQDQLYQSLEQQIQALQQANGQKVTSARDMASAPKVMRANSSAPVLTQGAAGGDIKSALRKIKSHNFNGAIKELKTIIATSGDADTVASATYYLTVSYAANSQYKEAIATGRKFVTTYPQNPNVPDALRTVYISQKQLGMKQSAGNTAKNLIQNYPDSEAAKKVAAEQASANQ